MVEVIQSRQNSQLKSWRKLLTTKGRKHSGAYLIEGSHLVGEALLNQVQIQTLIMSQSYFDKSAHDLPSYAGIPLALIDDTLVSELAQTQTSQGIFAIVAQTDLALPHQLSGHLYLLIDNVQDPGNVGTMIRTADACGAAGVVLGKGTVDLYNDKLQRSAQGSQWHIPIWQSDISLFIEKCQQAHIKVLASALNPKAQALKRLDPKQSVALIVGNEGQGVQASLINQADQQVYIEMPGQAESLNVAIAAAIMLYHFVA